ncbi:MAG: hypothetical protein JWO37_1860 [Acidimicrobiales bacterium]|nr:hypothetical protein [Acidimicrobiales bacterium]
MLSRTKLAAAGLTGALALTTGLAAANALPGAAQDVASDALAKVGVSVPGPNDHAGDHPNTRGQSTDHTADTATPNTPTSNGKGSEISNLAKTTDATGVDKGAEICTAASDGKCQAGQHGPGATAGTSGTTGNASNSQAAVVTPNHGAASDGQSNNGTTTADTASNGHSHQP